MDTQPGILDPPPPVARFLTFEVAPTADGADLLEALAGLEMGQDLLVGLGTPLLAALGTEIDGLRTFPALVGAGISVPSTQDALLARFGGSDRGVALHAARRFIAQVEEVLRPGPPVDAFVHRDSRDLTGFVDGTENPTGDDAFAAAIRTDGPEGMAGSSYVAVQQWVHDLDAFEAFDAAEQDRMIGRRRSDDTELEDAPASAHVRRSDQEGFDPPLHVVRRSMPWSDGEWEGLVFVAFGRSLHAFEAQLRRMVGLDDGITDALFRFTKPVSGGYYWCPPLRDGRLDLRALEA
jgi:putative iron-dependent peroxidase